MSEVIVAKISFLERGIPQVIGVSSGAYFGSVSGLTGGVWYPILDPRIATDINIATEHDGTRSTDRFGAIRLYNGGDAAVTRQLDRLIRSQSIGRDIEVRRGTDDQEWSAMEVWSRAEIDSIRFDEEEVTIVQRSRWHALEGGVNENTFTEAPNATLIGKVVPNVIGKVFQIGPLELDPPRLAYYLAENVFREFSNVTAKEGGNILSDDAFLDGTGNVFQLLRNPSLPLTFDVTVGNYPSSGGVSSETEYPMTSADGINPDAFTIANSGAIVTYPVAGTLRVITDEGIAGAEQLVTFGTLSSSLLTISGQNASGTFNGPGDTLRNSADVTFSAPSGLPAAGRHKVISAEFSLAASGLDDETVLASIGDPIVGFNKTTGVADQALAPVVRTVQNVPLDFSDLPNLTARLHYVANSGSAWSVEINNFQLRVQEFTGRTADIYSNDALLTPGHAAAIRILYGDQLGGTLIIGSAASVGGVVEEHVEILPSDISNRVVTRTITPTGAHLVIRLVPNDFSADIFEIKQIGISNATAVTGRLAILVTWMLERVADIQTADSAGSPKNIAFNSLAKLNTDIGNPEMGWYVSGGETVAEMLDLMVTDSACGIYVRDYDGVLRFALWRYEEPDSPIEIDSGIVNPRFASYIPRRITKRVVGGKNWVPLQRDQMAGITDTFSQDDRALIMEEYRYWVVGKSGGSFSTWPISGSI